MTTCDPAYETCPTDDNSTMEETADVAVFNPMVYAWGLIPVLQLASGFLISSAWSSAYQDHNDVTTTVTTDDLSVSDTAWSTYVMLNYIEGAAGLALFGAGVAVGGPAGMAFLWGSRFWILASAVNSYLAFSNDSCTGTAGVAAVAAVTAVAADATTSPATVAVAAVAAVAAVTAVASTNDCLSAAKVTQTAVTQGTSTGLDTTLTAYGSGYD